MTRASLFLLAVAFLVLAGCKPITITKSHIEEYTDPTTGKKITYIETITQTPGSKSPIHLTHPELYE